MLLANGQVKKMVSSYVGENKVFEQQFLSGELEVELNPQGTLAERIRAGGAGIQAFYTPTGYGTKVAEGKETREYRRPSTACSSTPSRADFALVKAWKGDRWGNLVYRKTARNFNSMMATAGKITIAEVEELVEVGELDPDQIHTPGDLRAADLPGRALRQAHRAAHRQAQELTTMAKLTREQIAMRAAQELRDGYYVNLGIGMPTLVANYIPEGVEVVLQSENGMLGIGPVPARGRRGPRPHQRRQADGHRDRRARSFFDSAESFAMIRGGHIDLAILGAMEVSAAGRPGQLDDPGQDGQGHGRRHGSGRRRPPGRHHDGARQQGRRAQDPRAAAPCRSPAWAWSTRSSPTWR